MIGIDLDIQRPSDQEPEEEAAQLEHCNHRWRTIGNYGGKVIVRECDLCGEEDEKDVS